jgi:ribosome maturation protein Sdo1
MKMEAKNIRFSLAVAPVKVLRWKTGKEGTIEIDEP